MENSEFVSIPGRRVKLGQQFREEETDPMFDTTVKMFSMENLGEHVFFRKKKIAREFGQEGEGEGHNKSEFLNKLAVLEGEPDVAIEGNSQEMEDWLRKLHIRKNHVIEQRASATTSRLEAVSHVAKTTLRLKGSHSSGTVHSRPQSLRSTVTAETMVTAVFKTENNAEHNPTKTVAARSRRIGKQSAEQRERKTYKKTSHSSGEKSSEICNTSKMDPSIWQS